MRVTTRNLYVTIIKCEGMNVSEEFWTQNSDELLITFDKTQRIFFVYKKS